MGFKKFVKKHPNLTAAGAGCATGVAIGSFGGPASAALCGVATGAGFAALNATADFKDKHYSKKKRR